MRRRPRIDLGGQPDPTSTQDSSTKDTDRLDRKRKRWAVVNKNRPASENPFLAAIKPDHDNYGEPNESAEELRIRLESLEFGNYPGYFNYRNKSAGTNSDDKAANPIACPLEKGSLDERLRMMKEEWFKGKDILDVGCNRGHITYAIAKTFSPKSILGVDIDLKMIHMANRDLHLHLEEDILRRNLEFRIKRAYKLSEGEANEAASSKPEQTTYEPQSDTSLGPLACTLPDTPKTDCDIGNESREQPNLDSGKDVSEDQGEPSKLSKVTECLPSAFPNNILFIEHNYVLSKDELVDKQKPYFDTIVCLSVTKWIHLNYRDDGLKRFFRRMYNHLKDGGLLVLEAQPFDNYHRKKKLSERLRANFSSIKFKPEQFDEYLLSDQVGFKQIVFQTTTEHECAGFKRPMKVFLK